MLFAGRAYEAIVISHYDLLVEANPDKPGRETLSRATTAWFLK
jgi:hypothetical protein